MSDMKIRLVCAACVAYGCKAGEMQSELRTTEAERKHHEMIAGCLRTDLEYMTRERDDLTALLATCANALRRVEAERGMHEKHSKEYFDKLQGWMQGCNEQIARATAAEARLAEYGDGLDYFLFQQLFHPSDRKTVALDYWTSGYWPEDNKRCKELAVALIERMRNLPAPPATGGE